VSYTDATVVVVGANCDTVTTTDIDDIEERCDRHG
jgi:hypothetical protein